MQTLLSQAVAARAAGRTPAFSDAEIQVVAKKGRPAVASWVRAQAKKHDVVRRQSVFDTFAKAVSRLSDAEVTLDPVEELLLALRRRGVISSVQRTRLHSGYLR